MVRRTVVGATFHELLVECVVPPRLFLILDTLWLSNAYLPKRSSRLHAKRTSVCLFM